MRLTLRLDSLRRLLIAVLAAILAAGLFAEIAENMWRARDAEDLLEFFSLSEEWNLPTWFSSVLLFSCGAVLAAIAASKRRTGALYLRHWWVLAAGFFYISLDEAVQIHEHAGGWVDVGGILYFDWVIPASILIAILGVSYLGFLAHLPRVTRWRFVAAGLLYVGGAVGMELPLGWWTDQAGRHNLTYALIDWVEESLEMIGASLFLYALVEYIAHPLGTLSIFVPEAGGRPDADASSAADEAGGGAGVLRLQRVSAEGSDRAPDPESGPSPEPRRSREAVPSRDE